jgi:glycosyltransferase involved in cell wall biosynthesis
MWGVILFTLGQTIYLAGVILGALNHFAGGVLVISQKLLWWSGTPVVLGLALSALDLIYLANKRRGNVEIKFDPPASSDLTVVLTAFNDELSIAQSVLDFKTHPRVRRVIVVDNDSSDETRTRASAAGAVVICHRRPGYGACVYRALTEGSVARDTALTLLCEGDMTFRAYDIDKFLDYIPHADIVNGTRIVEQLRSRKTQLTTFIYFGNFAVGKLLQVKYLGQGTFTDVGTTYKLCRNAVLAELLPNVNPAINLEFNAHFLDRALRQKLRIVECPITFHNRVGVSKGGNVSDLRALKVGVRMILGIVLGWKER